MRRWVVMVAVAGLGLLLAGVAIAAWAPFSKTFLTAPRASQSTGIHATVDFGHPSTSDPAQATQIVFSFPKGTRFNVNRVPHCTLNDGQIKGGGGVQRGAGSGTARLSTTPVLV